jgi:hypothetical protein
MNAYNPLASMKRIEAAGFKRAQAEVLAGELNEAIDSLVTNEQLELALAQSESRMTARVGVIVGTVGALIVAILGALISIN